MIARVLLAALLAAALVTTAPAQANSLPSLGTAGSTPAASSAGDGAATDEGFELTSPMKIVLVLTLLTVLPAVLMTVTAFTRIIIVLSFVRKALSIQDMPPNQIIIGLSLFLTIVVMRPILDGINRDALQPWLDEQISEKEAGEAAMVHVRRFLLQHTHDEEIQLFLDITESEEPETREDVPTTVLIPAFALSEMKIAFKMGFLIYIPFLIVDIVVASILLSMGMIMLPPVIISTPFKILLFIMVDGWALVIGSLMQSFQVPT